MIFAASAAFAAGSPKGHPDMGALDPQVLRDLAPSGRIRAAINFGNPILAQKHPITARAQGVSVDLAHELGRRLGVEVELVTFDAAGKVFEAMKSASWEIAFLAIDPVRSQAISFTAPYVIIEGTYLVRETSPLYSIADFDSSGVRIAVGRGAAYDLFLTRFLTLAEIVRADTSIGALELFVREKLDAAAGVRQQLASFAQAHPGLRVIEGRFTMIEQAMATPRGRVAGAKYLAGFIEEVKATGFIASALARSGQHDATIAPASKIDNS
jgi:polar amino acid transport system substrate-binding protein